MKNEDSKTEDIDPMFTYHTFIQVPGKTSIHNGTFKNLNEEALIQAKEHAYKICRLNPGKITSVYRIEGETPVHVISYVTRYLGGRYIPSVFPEPTVKQIPKR